MLDSEVLSYWKELKRSRRLSNILLRHDLAYESHQASNKAPRSPLNLR